MTRDQLLKQVEDLSALLRAIGSLAPDAVSDDLLNYLDSLGESSLSADILLSALKLQKGKK